MGGWALKSGFLSKTYRTLVKELLTVVVLLELRRRPLSGYDVMLLVFERFHVLLSSGTVYGCLYALERQRLIEGYHMSRKIVYRLTAFGLSEVDEFRSSKAQIAVLVSTVLNA